MIIEVSREKAVGDALPSKIYIDGRFFCYGLENSNYQIPVGVYSVYAKTSPKFGVNKVYINVPNRTSILFHGGNNADQTRGCVLVGKERNGEQISSDCSDELFDLVEDAYKKGETINVKVSSFDVLGGKIVVAGLAVVLLIYLLR